MTPGGKQLDTVPQSARTDAIINPAPCCLPHQTVRPAARNGAMSGTACVIRAAASRQNGQIAAHRIHVYESLSPAPKSAEIRPKRYT
jgi:hypothetical protein